MIKRKIIFELKAHLSRPEITLITGPRQAGKTTLMLLMQQDLDRDKKKTLMLNLDIESDKQFFASQSALLAKIQLELGREGGYVFLDEIQRKEDAGVFLKGLYDMNLPYKFIVSGSGSLELKEKIHESLAGRKKIFELSTVSFEEFANFKTNYAYEDRLGEFFAVERQKAKDLLEEYLAFGGYPKVILENTLEGKRSVINEIYQSYLEKDIAYLLRVRKTEDFSRLVKVMASQTGKVTNTAELSRTLGIAHKTVQDYLWYLQKTFILGKVAPFFKNTRKEITKSPAFYFCDLGFRNYALGAFESGLPPREIGFLFQNFVFLQLHGINEMGSQVCFWRTKHGAEVDFVLMKGNAPIPIEVKYQSFKKPEIFRALRNFAEDHAIKHAYVINLSLDGTISEKGTKFHFLPFTKIVLSHPFKAPFL